MENPFEFGRELGADELVDRQDEIAEVVRVIRGGEKLFLIGPRRYGKTSILKAADDRATQAGAIVLRYNAESYPTLEHLISVIVADAARALRGGVERAGEKIKQFFSKLRPELSFSVSDSAWKATLGAAQSGTKSVSQISLLVDMLDGLEKLAADQPRGRPVGLVIDEFQWIIELGGSHAEKQIRSAIQRHKHTGYVFAGSKTSMLTEMTTQASRPFYRLGSLRFVGPVPRTDFIQFLLDKFSAGGFKVEGATGKESQTGGAVHWILDLAEEVPYNVQLLAHTCWEQLSGAPKGGRILTEKAVRSSLELIARRYDPFYTQLWKGLTAIQQQTLKAVIREGGVNLLSNSVARLVGRGASTIAKSLEAMVGREILREEESVGSVRFRFEDPFFAVWIGFLPQTFK
jgi:AAA+ ATPase superfamily predicted ATPase